MKTDLIRQMLEDGKTPEDIYALAQKAQEEVNKTREEDKAVAESRTALIKAIDEYIVALCGGDHIGVEGVKDLEKSFIKFEKSYKDFKNHRNKQDKQSYLDDFFKFTWF